MEGLGIERILGFAAGLLIAGVGAFVLAAKPESTLHRLFFGLAVADGASTVFYQLTFATSDRALALYAYWLYEYAFIVFVFLLLVFGLIFPRPLGGKAAEGRLIAIPAVGLVLVTVAYAFWPRVFWTPGEGALPFQNETGHTLLLGIWIGATAFNVARMSWFARHHPSETHRIQASYVLGGIVLASGTFSTNAFMFGLRSGIPETFFQLTPRAFVYWMTAGTTVLLISAGLAAYRRYRVGATHSSAVVLACLGAVALLTAASLWLPMSTSVLDSLQVIALIAYPALLAYAIARYGVLGIDAGLRKAAGLTMAAVGIATAFLLVEEGVENFLQDILQGPGLALTANVVAALAAAILMMPVWHGVHRVLARVAPTLGSTSLDRRKLDIYEHALHGALADGSVEPAEVRTLAALRESLGVTMDDHARLMGRYRGTYIDTVF